MSSPAKVDCHTCVHFRSKPYEARVEGCYLEKNMPSKQKQAFLDEQQIPGNHEKINLRGDCPDHSERPRKAPWWKRLLSFEAARSEDAQRVALVDDLPTVVNL